MRKFLTPLVAVCFLCVAIAFNSGSNLNKTIPGSVSSRDETSALIPKDYTSESKPTESERVDQSNTFNADIIEENGGGTSATGSEIYENINSSGSLKTNNPTFNESESSNKNATSNNSRTEQPNPSASSNTQSNASANPSADERGQVIELVNKQRVANGLKPLEYRPDIQSAADIRGEEIITYFSHTRPNGTSCFTVLSEAGISYRAVGENIAYGQRSAEEVMNSWMNSSGHRANILNADFTGIAVGQAIRGNVKYWVQIFIK